MMSMLPKGRYEMKEASKMIPGFHCRGLGSIPGQGTEIPQAAWCSQIN